MGNQQAYRTVNKQVADCGPREAVTAAVFAGCRAAHRQRSRIAARTDRLVTWREERSSRQVFVKNGLVFGGNNCL